MARLDVGQEKEFGSVIVAPACIMPMLFLCFWAGSMKAGMLAEKQATLDNVYGKGLLIELVALAACLTLLLVWLIVAVVKNKKKRKPTAAYRTTEKVFNLDDPQSVLETLVLYQEFTSVNLHQDLKNNDRCNKMLFKMFEKAGWVSLAGSNLYVRYDVNNRYYKRFCLDFLDNTLKAVRIAEKLLAKEDNKFDFEKEDIEFVKDLGYVEKFGGEVKVYQLNKLYDYITKIRAAIKQTAYHGWTGDDVDFNLPIENIHSLGLDRDDTLERVEFEILTPINLIFS